MIQHPHIDQRQGVLQARGEQTVGLAGFGDTGGVVVGEDDGGGVMGEGALDHLAGVDAGAVDGAVEQGFEGQHPVAGVEEQAAEDFVGFVAQARL